MSADENKAAGAEGAGGNTGDGKVGDANKAPESSISKADHDKAVGDLKQQLEDLRMEILTPDYLEYLEKGKAPKTPEPSKKAEEVDFSKMTPEQIYNKARADAEKTVNEKIETVRKEFTSQSKESLQKEVAAFARSHEDYERYRPLMYGLSLDPKNKDLTLPELYNKAKEHAKGFGPTDDDKSKSRRSSNEKPTGSSGSYQRSDKKVSPEQAADEAWNEVVGEGGLSPA